MTEVREGDHIHVRATVRSVGRDYVEIVPFNELGSTDGSIAVYKTHILAVEPRPLAPNDIVEIIATKGNARVIAIHKNRLWLSDSAGNTFEADISEVTACV